MLTYTTVGTVCAAALLGGLVDLNVLDNQVAGVETLGVGVGLGVLEETEEELGRLDGPAGLVDTESLACVILSTWWPFPIPSPIQPDPRFPHAFSCW